MRVLVIEDDPRMAALLEQGLREDGGQVTLCHNGIEGLEAALSPDFDVIVLDLMLPGLDGYQLMQRLRRHGRQTPVLMLTARDAASDIVKGLDLGADDYVTKPFSLDVLLARVRAAARRGPATQLVVLKAGPITMNTGSHEVRLNDQSVALTRTEFSILEALLKRRDRVVTREALINEVWGHRDDIQSNTIDVFIKQLRAKLNCGSQYGIQTVRGVGYILRSDQE
jgi:DNA-binding response OmpR family regulator